MSEPISRHDFLNNLARGGLLLGLAGASAAALHGAKDPSECINTGYCAACNVHETCTLPERKEVRRG